MLIRMLKSFGTPIGRIETDEKGLFESGYNGRDSFESFFIRSNPYYFVSQKINIGSKEKAYCSIG